MPQNPAAQVFHVVEAEVGKTLAAVLRGRLPGVPWSQVQRYVRNRHVLIHGNVSCDEGRRIKAGEVIKLLQHPTAPPAREEDVRIRYEDEWLVVVEKPAGLTSVRHEEERNWKDSRKNIQPTLEDLLPRILAKRQQGDRLPRKADKPWKKLRDGDQRAPSRTHPVRPVHRLDRETSGLMVFARTVPAERHLGLQFRAHSTFRRYLAVVEGEVAEQTIALRLIRDRGDGRRGVTDDPTAGKSAVTHVTPVEKLARIPWSSVAWKPDARIRFASTWRNSAIRCAARKFTVNDCSKIPCPIAAALRASHCTQRNSASNIRSRASN
ncbi:MAG: RluA family pseudouridine synthase [Pirellulales bacterium]